MKKVAQTEIAITIRNKTKYNEAWDDEGGGESVTGFTRAITRRVNQLETSII